MSTQHAPGLALTAFAAVPCYSSHDNTGEKLIGYRAEVYDIGGIDPFASVFREIPDHVYEPEAIARVKAHAEAKANEHARLIAAAPELLIALQDALGVLSEPGIMDVDEWKAWQRKTIQSARTAIAKATQP